MSTASNVALPETDHRLAHRLKALGHPARLAIVRLLAERDECICGEIVDDLPLAQSTVSQHLKALKEAGLVQGTVEGRRTCYCLDREAVGALSEEMDQLFVSLASEAPACC